MLDRLHRGTQNAGLVLGEFVTGVDGERGEGDRRENDERREQREVLERVWHDCLSGPDSRRPHPFRGNPAAIQDRIAN